MPARRIWRSCQPPTTSAYRPLGSRLRGSGCRCRRSASTSADRGSSWSVFLRTRSRSVGATHASPLRTLRGRLALFGDADLQRHGDLSMELERYGVLADRLDRLGQNQLAPIDLEALGLEIVGDVHRGD